MPVMCGRYFAQGGFEQAGNVGLISSALVPPGSVDPEVSRLGADVVAVPAVECSFQGHPGFLQDAGGGRVIDVARGVHSPDIGVLKQGRHNRACCFRCESATPHRARKYVSEGHPVAGDVGLDHPDDRVGFPTTS